MPLNRTIATLCFLAAGASAQAHCPATLPLKGTQHVDNCYPLRAECVPAADALYQYSEAVPDGGEEMFSAALHGSPWHLFDGDMRYLDIEDLAVLVRKKGKQVQKVVLMASWSGIAPDKHHTALAQQLSNALGTVQVSAPDGFLWFDKDGRTSVTRQAFTVFATGPYAVKKDEPVMASLALAWPVQLEEAFAKDGDADGLFRAGVGQEAFQLCPERALAAFEAAAKLGHPIAAYNAAVLRLERNAAGDREAALGLLRKAAAAGDKPAGARLARTALRNGGKP
ncbi:hypothetical protein [Pseudoduganella violaceinigra]|uniref:hypothetical protein n=1 Tax=Pseudoduganella violaceinigra TaxID=246602 RepID=UPI0003F7CFE0|nr:hypothetical protein [Pseudoduganella violaceinigra]